MSDAQATIVRGVLAQRKFAIQVDVIYCDKAAVFINQALYALLERFRVLRCPPIF